MIRVNQIKCRPEEVTDAAGRISYPKLIHLTEKLMHLKNDKIQTLEIRKRSIDARKKPEIRFILSVDVTLQRQSDEQYLRSCRTDQCIRAQNKQYEFPEAGKKQLQERPVIIGMGPAGLFCGYELALHGYRPILLERGADVTERTADVVSFWESGRLKPESNVQFGEGGAGTFSDGKLNTLLKDKDGRNAEVLRIFRKFGAKEEILYDSKPHLGTDQLVTIVRRMREEMIALGATVRFHTRVTDFTIENEQIKEVITSEGERIPCSVAVLAIGHSARDTFQMLFDKQVQMEAKSFAVGLRVEHLQEFINQSQYGQPFLAALGAAPYKLTAKAADGRGVYSFCMCPGGYVVNASSEEGRLAVNGMSYSGRDSANANAAIIVSVTPEDYGSDHPLAGIAFQRSLEEKAYQIGQGCVPVAYYQDVKRAVQKNSCGNMASSCAPASAEASDRSGTAGKAPVIQPCIKGRYRFADVSQILPPQIAKAFVDGMEQFDHMIHGYGGENVLVEGIESRTSSPVRIVRNEKLTGTFGNLYPCGEGAGYAGGITSAAMDGMRVAETIASEYTL